MLTRYHRTDDLSDTFARLTEKAVQLPQVSKLGAGLFAKTYAHPNPAVAVKIAKLTNQMRRYDDAATQDGYMVYLAQIAKLPSKFAPKVFSCDIIQTEHKTEGAVVVVTLERLTPNSEVSKDQWGKLAAQIDPRLGTVSDLMAYHRRVAKSDNKDAAHIAQALSNTWMGRHGKDLHDGNWMLRRTAQGYVPVITDPAT